MNERIRELAEQAWDYVDSHNPYASDEQEMFQEKFAELIVRECTEMLACEYGQSATSGNEAAIFIRNHFGVKE